MVAVSWTAPQSEDASTRPSGSPRANGAHQSSPGSPRDRPASVSPRLSHWLGAACGSMGSEQRWMDLEPAARPWPVTHLELEPVRHIVMAATPILRATHHSANVHKFVTLPSYVA